MKDAPFQKSSFHPKLRWGALICSSAGFLVLLYHYGSQFGTETAKLFNLLHDPHQMRETISSFGAYAPLAYIVLQMMQVVLAPFPGAGGVIKFVGGYLFGTKAGFFYSTIALLLGSWAAFGLARVLGRWVVERLVSPKVFKKFDYLISHEGLILSFLLFLMPGFPKDALCYILGLTPMPLGVFLALSTLGRIPGTLMAIVGGAKTCDYQYKTLLILLGGCGLVSLLFYIFREPIHAWIKRSRKIER